MCGSSQHQTTGYRADSAENSLFHDHVESIHRQFQRSILLRHFLALLADAPDLQPYKLRMSRELRMACAIMISRDIGACPVKAIHADASTILQQALCKPYPSSTLNP